MDERAARAGAIYDEIGRTYASTRRPDPRVEAAIRAPGLRRCGGSRAGS